MIFNGWQYTAWCWNLQRWELYGKKEYKFYSVNLHLEWSIFIRNDIFFLHTIWTASSEFGTYRLCEQRRFRRACASAQSRQNLRYSLIQAVSQEEPSDRKPDPRPLWMAGHAQLKFVTTECSKTQIRLTGLIYTYLLYALNIMQSKRYFYHWRS